MCTACRVKCVYWIIQTAITHPRINHRDNNWLAVLLSNRVCMFCARVCFVFHWRDLSTRRSRTHARTSDRMCLSHSTNVYHLNQQTLCSQRVVGYFPSTLCPWGVFCFLLPTHSEAGEILLPGCPRRPGPVVLVSFPPSLSRTFQHQETDVSSRIEWHAMTAASWRPQGQG